VAGLPANAPISVVVGSTTVSAGAASSSGAAIAKFTAPATGGAVSITAPGLAKPIPAGTLTVGTFNLDALSGNYTVDAKIQYWNGSSFLDPPGCANIQKVTLTLRNTDRGNGAGDSTDILLQATNDLSVPSESVVGSVTTPKPLGTNFNFTTTVSGTPTTPTGTVSWSFPGGPSGTVCGPHPPNPDPFTLSGGSSTCVVQNNSQGAGCTIPAAGSYTALAAYAGDSNWTGTSSETTTPGGTTPDTIVISKGTPSVTTSYSGPSPAAIGSNLTFSATVAQSLICIVPTGAVTWTFPGAPAGTACSGGNTTNLASGVATCTVMAALPGTYRPVATYNGVNNQGDNNFNPGSSGNQASVVVSGIAATTTTVTASPTAPVLGNTITFTATVTGVPGLTPTGTVTWSFTSPGGAACSGGNTTTLNASGQATCQVTNAQLGNYSVTATYGGQAGVYAGSAGSTNVTVNKATPTVTVSGSPANPSTKNPLTFTATVQPPTNDPTPTGTVSWVITVSSGPTPTCSNLVANTGPLDANGQTTCTISPSSASVTYTVTATYNGDPNYTTATSTPVSHKG